MPLHMATRTVAMYIIISGFWILYSDTAITWVASDFETLTFLSSVKGLFFVVVTGLLLFVQLRRNFNALSDADLRADNAVLESAGAREALRLGEERWKLIVGNIRDYAVYLVDATGIIESWNEGARRIFGFESGEIVGKPFAALFGEEISGTGDSSEQLARALAIGETEFESWRVGRDGIRVFARSVLTALRTPDGDLRGYVEILQDITEHRRALDALKDSESRYRHLFEANPQPMWVYRMSDLRFLAVNTAAVHHYGYSTKEFLEMTIKDIRPPEEIPKLEKTLERQLTTDLRNSGVWKHLTADGKELDVEITAHAMFFDGEPAQLVLVNDVTERLRAERELRHSRNQLMALTNALQLSMEEERIRISREIHDDLGQRYAALNMDLALIARHVDHATDSSLRASVTQEIVSSRKLLDEIVESTRKIIRDLRPEVLDTLGLVSSIAWQAAETEKRHGIRCRTELPSSEIDAGPRVSTALFRITQEALTNVVRHSGATEVLIRLVQSNGTLTLEIGDNGKGLSQDDRDKVNSFGLLGMRERVLALGGTFEILALPGAGTRLVVSVPATLPVENA